MENPISMLSRAPEGYNGYHISIDEMNPEFNSDDGTVKLTNIVSPLLLNLKEGSIILVGSNTNPDIEGYGRVIKNENGKLTIKLLD